MCPLPLATLPPQVPQSIGQSQRRWALLTGQCCRSLHSTLCLAFENPFLVAPLHELSLPAPGVQAQPALLSPHSCPPLHPWALPSHLPLPTLSESVLLIAAGHYRSGGSPPGGPPEGGTKIDLKYCPVAARFFRPKIL